MNSTNHDLQTGIICPNLTLPRYTFGFMDATIFQAHSNSLRAAMSALSTICNLKPHQNIGHLQWPVPHSNTTNGALVKHRRILEDHFNGAKLDTTHVVGVYVTRPADAPTSDKRQGVHPAVAMRADPRLCPWTPPDMIGPIPLVRVSDMAGYDPDSRPGATARVEQSLGCSSQVFLSLLIARKVVVAI